MALPTVRFVFDEGSRVHNKDKGDAQKVGERLEVLTARDGGRLKPEAVVTDARSRRSPLHLHFEWSDKTAAEQYRLDQARELIRSVRIVADDGARPLHAYHSIVDDGRAYRTLAEIATNRTLQLQLLKQAEKELQAFTRRYQELSEVCTMVRVARDRLVDEIAKAESEPAAQPPPKRKQRSSGEARA